MPIPAIQTESFRLFSCLNCEFGRGRANASPDCHKLRRVYSPWRDTRVTQPGSAMRRTPLGHPPSESWIDPAQVSGQSLFDEDTSTTSCGTDCANAMGHLRTQAYDLSLLELVSIIDVNLICSIPRNVMPTIGSLWSFEAWHDHCSVLSMDTTFTYTVALEL